jgi:hypothetical protein
MNEHHPIRVSVRRRRWLPRISALYVGFTLCAIAVYASSALTSDPYGEQLPAISRVIVIAMLSSASIISMWLDNRR